MMTRTRVVDVVVVAYASDDLIEACVASVASDPLVSKVIVVDHGDGRSADIAERCGALVVRRPENPGFGAGQNLGVSLGCAPFVLLLNPDARLERSALSVGMAALEDPSVAAAQGIVRSSRSGTAERSAGRELGPVHLWGRALAARRLLDRAWVASLARRVGVLRDHVERTPENHTDVESLAAVSILMRREAFEAVGGFDEQYFLYGEDLDLCHRLRLAGWRLQSLATNWSSHHSGASASGWWHRELRWWEGTLQFSAQWSGSAAFVGALGAGCLMALRLVIVSPSRWHVAIRCLVLRPVSLRRHRQGAERS